MKPLCCKIFFKYILAFVTLCISVGCANSNTSVKQTLVIKGSKSSTLSANFMFAAVPMSLSTKSFKLHAGEAADCSDLQLWRRFGQSGKYFEFYNNDGAAVASARPPGTQVFRCVAIEFSDIIKFTPNTTDAGNPGACANQEYSFDLYPSVVAGWNDIDGNAIIGNASAEDRLVMYISTSGTAVNAVAGQVFPMAQALNTEDPFDIFFYVEAQADASPNCTLTISDIGLRL